MNYNANFSKTEKNIFNNNIDNEEMRSSIMSVYGILINNSSDGVSTLTYKKILGHMRKYKMSASMLKLRIEKLVALKLIEIIKEKLSKVKVKYSYKINRFEDVAKIYRNENQNENRNENNSIESIENTYFIDNQDMQNRESKIIYNNIYITASEKEALVKDAIKFFKIKDKLVINSINFKIKNKNLNEAGALKYIEKVIVETVLFFKQLGILVNAKARKVFNKKQKESKKLRFQNYDQREYKESDFDEICGWDD